MNDYSNDSSLEKLENLSKQDHRIKILNNDKNYGLLYSRAMGILNSSGEYLMNLDSDDELNGQDSLEFLYNKAILSNVDLITFSFFYEKKNRTINICDNINIIQQQPEIFISIFQSNNNIKDYFIWNKIIKREIFQKAYKFFESEIYHYKWNYFEDDIWNILVNRFAKTKLCIDKLIYIYNYNNDSLINRRYEKIMFQNLLYRHEMYKKIFPNKENEKYLIAEYIFLFNRLRTEIKNLLLINDIDIKNEIIHIFKFNCSKPFIH